MIMQLAGDSDAGPPILDRDDPDDYKETHAGKTSTDTPASLSLLLRFTSLLSV